MTAFTICSIICEMAVGTMEPIPWKNPRMTPSTAAISMHGASTRSAYTLISMDMMLSAMNPAPKKMRRETNPPAITANINAPLNTLYAFLYSPNAIRADTSFDTASGRL